MALEIFNDIDSSLYTLDLIGTMVFAISGAMAASSKRLDLFGASFIAFVTAVGGGTIRDLLIGATPVGWMGNIMYLYIILLGVIITFLFKGIVRKLRKALFLFDTIGIGVFTVLGVKKALLVGIDPPIAVMMGMFSAVLGGVLRDMLLNEIPLIFQKEIYAMACILGGVLFVILQHFGLSLELNSVISIFVIITSRVLAIRFKIGLSSIDDDQKKFFKKQN